MAAQTFSPSVCLLMSPVMPGQSGSKWAHKHCRIVTQCCAATSTSIRSPPGKEWLISPTSKIREPLKMETWSFTHPKSTQKCHGKTHIKPTGSLFVRNVPCRCRCRSAASMTHGPMFLREQLFRGSVPSKCLGPQLG